MFLNYFNIIPASPKKDYVNVSSTNYYVQYQRFRRTDVTISSKSISFFVSPLLNSPLRRGELTSDFVLHRGNSLKFIPFISSNSRYLDTPSCSNVRGFLVYGSIQKIPNRVGFYFLTIPDLLPDKTAESNWKSNWKHIP